MKPISTKTINAALAQPNGQPFKHYAMCVICLACLCYMLNDIAAVNHSRKESENISIDIMKVGLLILPFSGFAACVIDMFLRREEVDRLARQHARENHDRDLKGAAAVTVEKTRENNPVSENDKALSWR